MQRVGKYEFSIKVEQTKKMVSHGDYETVMKIADTIDWHRVWSIDILFMAATIYERNRECQEAEDILLLAFERVPIGKHLLFKLAGLAIKEGNFQEAEDYYREFCDLAPDDPGQYVLRYLILEARGVPAEQLTHTLEQYCNIELDEKWLYELTGLYTEADMGEPCIMACDEIMFAFGLGEYMEKAMELRIQFTPLTRYRMDLVENRDKYEVRLEVVEQEYRTEKRPVDYEPMPERKTKVSPQSYMARQEATFAVEPETEYPEDGYAQAGHQEDGYAEDDYAQTGYQEAGYAEEECPEDDYSEGDYQRSGYQAEVYQEDTCTDEDDPEEAYGRRGYYGDECPDQNPQDDARGDARAGYPEEHCGNAAGARKSYEDEGAHTRVAVGPEDSEEEEKSTEETQSQWISDKPQILSDRAVRARIHGVEVQADLAREMSMVSDGRHRPEITSAQTRVLAGIEDLGRESSVQESYHFMVKAGYPSSGLDQTIELLKKIHEETRIKNQAAKIARGKLNSKDVFTTAGKLTGKDLIIERTGAMEESTSQELSRLMTRGETGMDVVLTDVADNLVRIRRVYPGLAKRFEYVGKMRPEEAAYVAPEGDDRPVHPVRLRKAEEPVMPRKVQSRKEEPAVSKAQPVPEPAAPRSLPKPESEQRPDTGRKVEIEQKPDPIRRKVEESRPEPVTRRGEHKEVSLKAAENPPVLPRSDESDYDNQQEMDINEFTQYVCQYASDIDYSISGKNMLALYEQIEAMEEDSVPLTKVNAEDLIEEAADKAEDPSLFKRITGIFSSKYDKDDLLILKGKHFIW